MILRQPWTPSTTQAFADEAHRRNMGILYLPGYQELGLEPLSLGALTLDDYVKANAGQFDFEPTTDDSPFFYQFTPGLPEQVSELLFVSLVAAAIYLSWAMFFYIRRDGKQPRRIGLAPYFALLGAAFMLVEISLIQRFNLLLGQPALGLVTVIGGLLVGGGLGSLFSNRFVVERLPGLVGAFALAVALAVAATLVIYPPLIDAALPLALPARLLVTLLAVLPLGFLMGVPFPSGLRVADRADPQGIAAFWGANAVTSVVGSAAAMALAIGSGFSAALLAGAGVYALAAVMAFLIWPRLLR
jgi:hypothetical protein